MSTSPSGRKHSRTNSAWRWCRAALPHVAPAARVMHAHDWHAALVPVYLRTTFKSSACHQRLAAVLSVHNAAFHGLLPESSGVLRQNLGAGVGNSLGIFVCRV